MMMMISSGLTTHQRAPVAWWIRELTLNPLGFSPLWFEPSSGHMWESQVLLTDGQVVFLQVLRFSPTFDERSARYKWNILERAVKPKSKKKKKKKKINDASTHEGHLRQNGDDDEFRFNDASTHEGHLRQNGELTWFCSVTIIMISHKCIKCKTRTNLKIKAVILC